MAKIFKPRRGLRSTCKTGEKKNIILEAGEMMFVGKAAIGGSSRHDIYIGDGSTTLENLKPALYGDTSEEDIIITNDSSATATAALDNVVSGKSLGQLLGSLKRAINLNTNKISKMCIYEDICQPKCDMISLSPIRNKVYDISISNRFGVSGLLWTRNNSGAALYFLDSGFGAISNDPLVGTEGGQFTYIDDAHFTYTQSSSSTGALIIIGWIRLEIIITEVNA